MSDELKSISVAVLIVAFNGRRYLGECLTSIQQAVHAGIDLRVWVVDNASTDGTAEFVTSEFSWCTVLRSDRNLGFAGGNNWGWVQIEKELPECDFLYLLNQDTVVDRGFLSEAVSYLKSCPNAGAAQSLLMLHPEAELINTAGNSLHYLGFGLPTRYREPRDASLVSGVIGYPSGAAVLVRAELIRKHGLFTDELFMYLEDAELGWRLHLLGQPPHLCATSVVYHKYTFASTLRSYGYLERNRWWLIASHYRWRTLGAMLPMLLLMEVGQWMYALSNGLGKRKLWAYFSFCSPKFLRSVVQSRRDIERLRVVNDGDLLERMVGDFKSPHLRGVLVTHVANPLLRNYLRFMKWLVVW